MITRRGCGHVCAWYDASVYTCAVCPLRACRIRASSIADRRHPVQDDVLAHGHDILEPFVVEKREDLGAGEAAIEPHAQPRLRKRRAQERDEPVQHAERAARRRRIARAQDRRAEILLGLVIEGHERQQRQVAPRVVVPIEERELLRAMRRVIGGIEVDRDAPRAAVQPALMPVDDPVRERVAHLIQLGPTHGVLEARDRRLRGQRGAVDRIAVEQQLLDRIVRQPVAVVGIRVAARDAEDALRHELVHGVGDAARGAAVSQARRQRAVTPRRASAAFSRIAPPSELACA